VPFIRSYSYFGHSYGFDFGLVVFAAGPYLRFDLVAIAESGSFVVRLAFRCFLVLVLFSLYRYSIEFGSLMATTEFLPVQLMRLRHRPPSKVGHHPFRLVVPCPELSFVKSFA
jgi:hypothetical protein